MSDDNDSEWPKKLDALGRPMGMPPRVRLWPEGKDSDEIRASIGDRREETHKMLFGVRRASVRSDGDE